MLSIGKCYDAEYPLTSLARNAEEYYLGRGEAPGRWTASSEALFGLTGEVDEDALRTVVEGRDPRTGRMLAAGNRKIAAYDLCFRAPKSVSVLFGLGDPDTARIVGECHDDAVDAALGYVERAAAWTRKGRDGIDHVETPELVVAAFRHRTSRAGDPHLHTHSVVANLARTIDGQWGALHSQLLYWHASTAGYLYESELRMRLTERLGVAWGPVTNGIADVAGVPDELLKLFSKRRAQIEAQLDELGYSSPRAAEIAALDTRRAKVAGDNTVSLRDLWRTETTQAGHDLTVLDDVVDRPGAAREFDADQIEDVQRILEGPAGLTERASTFDRRDVLRAWAARFPEGAPTRLIERLADEFLARPEVVSRTVSDGQCPVDPTRAGKAKAGVFSTRELMALEHRLVAGAVSRRHDTVGIVDEQHLAAALRARPTLADEQAALVASLTTSGAGVEIVSAAAGTGKTFSLDAAREAWEAAEHRVIGCALAARAAAQLESSAAIPSDTLTRLLGELDRHGQLSPRTVVVCDEAAMVDSRTMTRLLDHAAAAGAKVVLVGDEKQLSEIGAGGAFRGLRDRLGAHTLTENRRQQARWERDALRELRDGDVDLALAAYHEHGRIVTASTAPDVRARLVADWWAASLAGEHPLMIAARWVDVEDLNNRARARMAANEQLAGPTLTAGERGFQIGDRVLALRNDRGRGLRNGSLGTVTALDAQQSTLTVRLDTGETSQVTERYLDAGHLAHGYATTAHKAQGITCDRALLLGNDTLYRELGYVAMSRGRLGNHLYVVDPERDDTATVHPRDRREPLDLVATALHRSEAQTLAIDTCEPAGTSRSSRREELRTLLVERRQLEGVLAPRPPDPSIERDALVVRRRAVLAEVREAEDRLAALGPRRLRERIVRADTDRVLATTRLDHAREALHRIDAALDQLDDQLAARHAFDAQHRHALEQHDRLDRLIDAKLAAHLADIGREPPDYLTRAFGPIPNDRPRAASWWRITSRVEQYRIEAGLTGTDLLGSSPTDHRLAGDHHLLVADAQHFHRLLVVHPPERSQGLAR